MDSDRTPAADRDEMREPENDGASSGAATPDPNDEIPVPIAMYPSEIDERAQVVEKLREEANIDRDEQPGLQP